MVILVGSTALFCFTQFVQCLWSNEVILPEKSLSLFLGCTLPGKKSSTSGWNHLGHSLHSGRLLRKQILRPCSQKLCFSQPWVGAFVGITSTPGVDCYVHCQDSVFTFVCAKFCVLNEKISYCRKLVNDDKQEIFLRNFYWVSLSLQFGMKFIF